MKSIRPITAFAASLAAALALAGCTPSEKIAVRVNKDTITEKEFLARVQAVDAISLGQSAQRGGPVRAGEYAMRELIDEHLLFQLAAEKGAPATDAQIKEFIAFAKRYPAFVGEEARIPGLTDEQWTLMARRRLSAINVGMKTVTMTDAEIQTLYQSKEFEAQVKEPDRTHLRLIVARTEGRIREALAQIGKGVPFETAALKLSEDPQARQRSGDAGDIPDAGMPPAMRDAVAKLAKPLDYTGSPIMIRIPNAPAGTPPTYLIAQLVERKPGRMPELAQVRMILQQRLLGMKNPKIAEYMQTTMRDAVQKATIKVELKEYEVVAEKLKASVSSTGAGSAPAPAPAP